MKNDHIIVVCPSCGGYNYHYVGAADYDSLNYSYYCTYCGNRSTYPARTDDGTSPNDIADSVLPAAGKSEHHADLDSVQRSDDDGSIHSSVTGSDTARLPNRSNLEQRSPDRLLQQYFRYGFNAGYSTGVRAGYDNVRAYIDGWGKTPYHRAILIDSLRRYLTEKLNTTSNG